MKVVNKKMIKILSVTAAILVIIVSVVVILHDADYVSNEAFKEVIKVTDKGFEYADEEKSNYVKVRDEKEVYNDMHRMANTKIVADEVWGEDEINEENLNKVILEVMKCNYSDKEKLLQILHNWKTGNFKNAVEEHNYVWEKLGGTVGKAKALKNPKDAEGSQKK